MKLAWTKGLSAEQKAIIKAEFEATGILRERLSAIVRSKIESSRKDATLKSSYENPNWAYLQADNVGFTRALEEILSILE